jgi:MFS superfamily sulfate permease-like transporter
MKPPPHVRNDIFAGLVSATVAIPLAMGFGMFAFAALGEDYFADGALAGIATAFVVAIVCVLLGDKTTTVYAPRITTTFFLGLLIYGLVHSDEPMMTAGGVPLILAIAFAIVLLAGALQALFGLIKLGTLIKFMPQPVMAGFQNAAAALLFLVQLGNVCGFDRSVAFTQVPQHLASIKPLSLAIAALTFAMMWNAKKLLPKIPPIIVGIGLGCMLYYLCKLAGLGSYLGPIIASGPRTAIGLTAFPYFSGLARGGDLAALVPTILSGALALAIIASIDALLCAKLVTASGEPRRDGNWLLVRLGTGNLVAACIGGITSGVNIGPSVANRAFGARTPLSVLVNAAVLLIAGSLLFRWLGEIPRVALSAVIMVVAVQHFDVWSLRLVSGLRGGPAAYRFNTALDLAVVVVVAVLSIALNIVPAVFIGVAIAIALFVFRMSRSLVRRSYRCGAIHSRKSRTDSERAFLERAGDAILVMELQGALFFGTGEKMLSDIAAVLRRETSCVILDLRRLTEIDSTGASAVVELKSDLAGRQTKLLLVGGNTMALDRLQNLGALACIVDADILPDVDRAIERAEDDLLRAEPRLRHTEVPLTTVGLFAGFCQSELDAIEPLLRRAHYEKGSVIFREGDPGDELLIVTNGTASAYLQLPQMNVRLASFAPGTMFGELALLDEGPRSATVIADEELVCYALSKSNFAVLAAKAPDVAIRLVAAIGRELSGRLRGANRTIHQLET